MDSNTYIIVVTYNGIKWISKCLESARPYQVVVVDNNSSDGTVEFIENSFSNTVILKQNNNLGFGTANNIGINHALKNGAEHIFLLNQDAYLQQNSLTKLIDTMEANPQIGLLSPIHLSGNNMNLDYNFASFVLHRSDFKLYSDLITSRPLKDYYEVDFINAAAWLISKKCLEAVGGFDPIFFHYGEDENFCQRVLYHNFKIAVCPDSYINHDREQKAYKKTKRFETELLEKETVLKIKYANINAENKYELKGRLKQIRNKLFRSAIKLNKGKHDQIKAEARMIKRILKEIECSKTKNKISGPNYLEYDF